MDKPRGRYSESGPEEIFFRKPYLRRQRVVARHRPSTLQPAIANKLTTAARPGVMSRFWRRWFSWFPLPTGSKV